MPSTYARCAVSASVRLPILESPMPTLRVSAVRWLDWPASSLRHHRASVEPDGSRPRLLARRGVELEGDGVDAVAVAARWPVVEHVAQVPATRCAGHLSAAHEQAAVLV